MNNYGNKEILIRIVLMMVLKIEDIKLMNNIYMFVQSCYLSDGLKEENNEL